MSLLEQRYRAFHSHVSGVRCLVVPKSIMHGEYVVCWWDPPRILPLLVFRMLELRINSVPIALLAIVILSGLASTYNGRSWREEGAYRYGDGGSCYD